MFQLAYRAPKLIVFLNYLRSSQAARHVKRLACLWNRTFDWTIIMAPDIQTDRQDREPGFCCLYRTYRPSFLLFLSPCQPHTASKESDSDFLRSEGPKLFFSLPPLPTLQGLLNSLFVPTLAVHSLVPWRSSFCTPSDPVSIWIQKGSLAIDSRQIVTVCLSLSCWNVCFVHIHSISECGHWTRCSWVNCITTRQKWASYKYISFQMTPTGFSCISRVFFIYVNYWELCMHFICI